ncbi:hypothetical protein THAOC_10218 [Thalassiosira oceanica]|uniref:2Fe-2S ferredoxin-type domain-containing protein n=1 Tax=Thalassiosira oceanica TaxID=159749 RepID=K0TDG5_THAOC|nr:hypothetical protein THAOC_10218 [Thalassiosira oceanica]|eukprot:EJK68587.1 hypothetical protein THAOC_10218 [Thalassiosira oceanica]
MYNSELSWVVLGPAATGILALYDPNSSTLAHQPSKIEMIPIRGYRITNQHRTLKVPPSYCSLLAVSNLHLLLARYLYWAPPHLGDTSVGGLVAFHLSRISYEFQIRRKLTFRTSLMWLVRNPTDDYKAAHGSPESPLVSIQTMMSKLAFVAAVAAAAAAFSEAFMLPPAQNANGVVKSTSSTSLNIFGGLKGAFANDDSLGERENAGLKNGPKTNDQVSGCHGLYSTRHLSLVTIPKPFSCMLIPLKGHSKRKVGPRSGCRSKGVRCARINFLARCRDVVTLTLFDASSLQYFLTQVVCSKARAKVSYNCQNGECGTCTIRINGRPSRVCTSSCTSEPVMTLTFSTSGLREQGATGKMQYCDPVKQKKTIEKKANLKWFGLVSDCRITFIPLSFKHVR